MTESVEVRLARLEENFKFLVEDAKEAKLARKGQYETMEAMSKTMINVGNDIVEVKAKLAGQAPTIEEFITIKHKVVGAGMIGKWVWAAGAGIIGFVYGAREHLLTLLTK